MAYTQADLDRLDAVIARGELTVEFADRRVTYRSMEELLQARAVIADALAAASSTPRPRQYYPVVRKGF
jgi:hypothetical protein